MWVLSTVLASVCFLPNAAGIRSKVAFYFFSSFCCCLHLNKTRVVQHQSQKPLFILWFSHHRPCVWGFQVQRPNCSLRHKQAAEAFLSTGRRLHLPLKHLAVNAAWHSQLNNAIRGGGTRSEPIRSEQWLADRIRLWSHNGLCCHSYWGWNTNEEVWSLPTCTGRFSQWPCFAFNQRHDALDTKSPTFSFCT